jgi:hypothetical protein
MKTIEQILAEYKEKSEDPKNENYSPLQCAVYDGDFEEVQALLFYYDEQKTTLAELSYVSPETNTKENILHVAMKHPAIFDLICWAITEHDSKLFSLLIQQGDIDNDTIFHQIAEFGRVEALKLLMPHLAQYVEPDELQAAFKHENRHQETASEIADHGPKSTTVEKLVAAKIITQENLDNAAKNRDQILAKFSEIAGSLQLGASAQCS